MKIAEGLVLTRSVLRTRLSAEVYCEMINKIILRFSNHLCCFQGKENDVEPQASSESENRSLVVVFADVFVSGAEAFSELHVVSLQSLMLQIAANWIEQEKKDIEAAKEAYMAENCPTPDLGGDQAALMVRRRRTFCHTLLFLISVFNPKCNEHKRLQIHMIHTGTPRTQTETCETCKHDLDTG